MKLIIFNVKISTHYNGIEDNSLDIYDRFYKEKKGNDPELYNFQDYNGYCYGYCSLREGVFNLSTAQFTDDNSIFMENATIIWVHKKGNKYALTGWYKNAEVYNFLQRKLSYPSLGRDLYFNTKASSNDCFLLPPEHRNIEIDIQFGEDKKFYIEDENGLLYKKITQYMLGYTEKKFNTVLNMTELVLNNPPNNPLLLAKRGNIYLNEEYNFLEALRYFNTALLFENMLDKKGVVDLHYYKGVSLQLLNNFGEAILEFEKVLKYTDYDLNIIKNLVYLCMENENYTKGIKYCDNILDSEIVTDENAEFLDKIICTKIDALIIIKKYAKAKEILKKIIKTTKIGKLKIHCQEILKNIEKI